MQVQRYGIYQGEAALEQAATSWDYIRHLSKSLCGTCIVHLNRPARLQTKNPGRYSAKHAITYSTGLVSLVSGSAMMGLLSL